MVRCSQSTRKFGKHRRPVFLLLGLMAALSGTKPDASEGVEARPAQPSGSVFITQYERAPIGAVLRLDDLAGGVLRPLVPGLNLPGDIVCGPDRRLYFNEEFVREGNSTVHRIWRVDQDGRRQTLVAQFDAAFLRPSAMVFAPNGDLYFGTVSTAPGQRSQGLWRIPGVAQAGVRFNRPVNVLPGSRFAAPPNGLTGVGVAASAFMTAGPFAGQMLVREEPRVFELAGAGPEDPGDRLLRLPPPGFMAFEELIPQGVDAKTMLPIRLDGVAVNSEGDIFSTDVKQNRVLRHGPDGSLKGIFAVVKSPNLLAVGPDDLVYVTNTEFPDGDTIQGGVFVYDPQGNLVGKIDQPLALLGVAVCRN